MTDREHAGSRETVALTQSVAPQTLAWRRLRSNRVALCFGALFLAIAVMCILAPVYARHVAHTGPNTVDVTGTVKIGNRNVDIISPSGIPVGPTWQGRYLLGADLVGRDVAVRLLYGGRASLEIAVIATFITMTFAILMATLAGYFGGFADAVLSRVLDVIWSFPVILLGIALGVALAAGGLNLGVTTIQGNSLLVPAGIIGFAYIPYVARPLRGQVLQLREREFVQAARVSNVGHLRIMTSEILPNLTSTILVFIPLMMANSILLEAGLSFLGAGVQPPNASWGTMLSDGIALIPGSFHLVLAPGIMLVLTVLGVNVFGDGVRDAFDPRARIQVRRR
jgi:peptide/nickel transport system permease protein